MQPPALVPFECAVTKMLVPFIIFHACTCAHGTRTGHRHNCGVLCKAVGIEHLGGSLAVREQA